MLDRRSAPVLFRPSAGELHAVTLYTKDRQPLFGCLDNGAVRLSTEGEIAREEWLWTPIVRDSVVSDAFVVMPDHVCVLFSVEPGDEAVPGEALQETVETIVQHYRSTVTMRICATLGRDACQVWQENYDDRIVRSPREAAAIRRGFRTTPVRCEHALLAA